MAHDESQAAQAALASMEAMLQAMEENEGCDVGKPAILYNFNTSGPIGEITTVIIKSQRTAVAQAEEFKRLVDDGWVCVRIQTERAARGIYNYQHETVAYLVKPKTDA